MADEAQTIRSINWREVFPFTNLFRAFRIAVHPSKLLLALAALLLIYTGGRILDGAWPEKHSARLEEFMEDSPGASQRQMLDIDARLQRAARGDFSEHRRGIFISFFEYEAHQITQVTQGVLRNDWFTPGRGVFYSIFYLIAAGPGQLVFNHPVYALLFFAWFLLVWSVFGGAISRIAAVHVARDEKISVRQALRF